MNKNTGTRGYAGIIVQATIGLVLLALVGVGTYIYKNPKLGLIDERIKTKTVYISTSTVSYVPKSKEQNGSYPVINTANAYNSYSGPAYRNSNFGLTVPGNYQVNPIQTSYAGVPATASYEFYTNGILAFTINVFSKEQWNDIRIQETVTVAENRGTDPYYGEGRYLGENTNWIYSYIPGAYAIPSSVSFY